MKKALIVGNGKSSVNPNAEGLNEGKDVFRLNKFFLEPKPIFGNNLKFVTFPGEPYTIYLINYLIKKNVYNIDMVVYRKMMQKRFFIPKVESEMHIWDELEKKYSTENTINGFKGVNKINKIKKVDKVTTGPYLINMAIQMGYDEISIIGIDFYSESSKKKYPIIIPNSLKKISIFDAQYRSIKRNKKKNNSYDDNIHSLETDKEYLKELFNTYRSIKFNVYVDEENPYFNWQKLIENLENVKLIKLDEYSICKASHSHCLDDIDKALIEYKKKYYLKDEIMNIKHNWSNRKSIMKKFFMYLSDKI